jgi:hypothetical protein
MSDVDFSEWITEDRRLKNLKPSLVPKFIVYVYEEVEDRVGHRLFEELHGRHPNIRDLRICEFTVQQLYSIGIIHENLNKYNIIITGHEAKLFILKHQLFRKRDFTKRRVMNYGNSPRSFWIAQKKDCERCGDSKSFFSLL